MQLYRKETLSLLQPYSKALLTQKKYLVFIEPLFVVLRIKTLACLTPSVVLHLPNPSHPKLVLWRREICIGFAQDGKVITVVLIELWERNKVLKQVSDYNNSMMLG